MIRSNISKEDYNPSVYNLIINGGVTLLKLEDKTDLDDEQIDLIRSGLSRQLVYDIIVAKPESVYSYSGLQIIDNKTVQELFVESYEKYLKIQFTLNMNIFNNQQITTVTTNLFVIFQWFAIIKLFILLHKSLQKLVTTDLTENINKFITDNKLGLTTQQKTKTDYIEDIKKILKEGLVIDSFKLDLNKLLQKVIEVNR